MSARAAGKTRTTVRRLSTDPTRSTPSLRAANDSDGTDDENRRPQLVVRSNPDGIRALRAALNDRLLPRTYVSDGHPVHIERISGTAALAVDDDSPLPVRAATITGPRLANLLAHHLELRKESADHSTEWTPPQQVLHAVLAGAEWPGLQPFTGIVGMPVLRRDGTLLQDPGHDPATGLFLAPKVTMAPVPADPSPEQVTAARSFVVDRLLGDFEWESDADRANYLGLLVTPFLRRYLRCLSPLGIISATMPGSGKTILTAIIGLLTGQRVLAWAEDDTELRKAISSVFTDEAGVVVFDNLAEGTVIASPILANLLTSTMWSDRILGSTRTGTWANERMWLVTGNNLRVGGDIASRAVLVRLSPRAPHPETRTGFTIPNLDTWILDPRNRGRVLWNLLVLILDWCNASAPRGRQVPPMRQFTSWAQGIAGLLAHHHIPAFLGNLHDMRGIDEEDQKWAGFLAMWRHRHQGNRRKAREIFDDAAPVTDPLTGRDHDPWDGQFITSDRGMRPRSPVQLGQWLTGHVGRFHADLRLRSDYDTHTKTTWWWVEEYHQP